MIATAFGVGARATERVRSVTDAATRRTGAQFSGSRYGKNDPHRVSA